MRKGVIRRAPELRRLAMAMAGVLAGTMALLGCARDEFAPFLAFPMPQKFANTGSARPSDVSRWWAHFGSRELDFLMDAANIDNLDIAVAVAQLQEAEAQVRVVGAALLPAIGYDDTSTRSQFSGTTVPGVIGSPVVRDSFTKVLSASYVLDLWGQNRDALEAAVRSRAASAYQLEVVRLATRAAAVNDFLLFAANYQRAAVARANTRNAQRILTVIGERRNAGTAAELDIAQQRSLVEIQRATIPPLVQAAEAARIALALLVGRPAQGMQLATSSLERLRLPRVAPGLPATLLLRRPDIRAAEQQLLAADANVDVARKAFLPAIQLTGQAGYQSALLATLLRPESAIYSMTAGVTQPIFDGDKLRGQLAQSTAQRQQMLEAYRKTIVQALSDVETALVAMRENRRRENAQRLAVAAARRAFALSELRLREGTIDLQTLLNTQITLFQAEDTLIQIRLARLQAAAALYQALGGDWEDWPAMSPVQ
jgi:NodT family efflux transporter outer membrane factor (OMF) lipoprotein